MASDGTVHALIINRGYARCGGNVAVVFLHTTSGPVTGLRLAGHVTVTARDDEGCCRIVPGNDVQVSRGGTHSTLIADVFLPCRMVASEGTGP